MRARAQVIQWCEGSYQTGDKQEVMATTKEYLADALESIAADVGDVAQQLTDFIDLQARLAPLFSLRFFLSRLAPLFLPRLFLSRSPAPPWRRRLRSIGRQR